jgi:hypothetical protein
MANSFHTTLDARPDPPPRSRAELEAAPGVPQPYIGMQRELRFNFSPHFHPYVAELIQRLIDGSVAGLQAVDTEFGTPVTLSAPAPARTADDRTVTLAAGETVRLPDGARLTVAPGTSLRLSGDRFVRSGDGSIAAAPSASTPATVAARTRVLRDTGDRVILEGDTRVALAGGQPRLTLHEALLTAAAYGPSSGLVNTPYPVKELDFAPGSAYAVYNWELFFHVPLTLAIHLSRNQRFAEAQRWFHYIFDPTGDRDGSTPESFWKVKAFQQAAVVQREEMMVNLATGEDVTLRDATVASIQAWRDAPFRPHVVAEHRPWAYMLQTLMAYVENLIAWGDERLKEGTSEGTNEATQLYVLAANLLGPRPQAVPRRPSVRPQTYASLRNRLDAFGNALRELETHVPLDSAPGPRLGGGDSGRRITLRGMGALYFCVPPNDKLLGYWDTVADRLFKIRNSLNIQGVFRQLPLFDPPIDPALLARGAAAGLDVGAIVRGADQPLPLVRFQFLVQKAAEICQEVKSLGSSLLAAMEKEDNEALAIMRARHERTIMGLVETVRYGQHQEAIKAREAVEKSLAGAIHRYTYYERLLGKQESEIKIPALDALDASDLAAGRLTMFEQDMLYRPIAMDMAPAAETAGARLSTREAEELQLLELASIGHFVAGQLDLLGSGLGLIPQFTIHAKPLGVGAGTGFGGVQLARMASLLGGVARAVSERQSYDASRAAKMAGYARREQEWALQSNLAAAEITQLHKQLRAAQIREAVAERERTNHQRQIRQAEEIEAFLTAGPDGKATNEALYAWMKREVRGLYGQCLQLAFETAKKAERALRHELGDDVPTFVQSGYTGGREGLLAGERLYLDVKRMELAYQELNRREYELTKHASLLQLDPAALLRLRATGSCTLSLPETLFDMDAPGHYFRRIRTVAMSIPSVTGPYTSVNCTLTLISSTIRKTAALARADDYARRDPEDSRFDDHIGGLQAIVTSSAQNDSGMFEVNMRDERVLPFEGSGVVSEWRLELPANPANGDPRQFDYDTIADVILHLRYTARDGGSPLRDAAMAHLKGAIDQAQAAGSVRLLSIRHEFPSEWARFKSTAVENARLTLNLRSEHYPFWSESRHGVRSVDLFARLPARAPHVTISARRDGTDVEPIGTLGAPALGNLRTTRLRDLTLPQLSGELTLYFSDTSVEELWVALTWGLAPE